MLNYDSTWKLWFAWYPVPASTGFHLRPTQFVWLRTVLVRRNMAGYWVYKLTSSPEEYEEELIDRISW